jgi:DNA repair protein RadC
MRQTRTTRCSTFRTPDADDRRLSVSAESLNDQELLGMILLGLDVSTAQRLLELHAGQLGRLFAVGSSATLELTPRRRARFAALRELACRLAAERVPRSDPFRSPDDVARYLHLRYCARDQEALGALYLTNKGALLTHREIYRGVLSRACAEPREILKHALYVGAASFVVFHTHPSGDPAPSVEDQAFTHQLAAAAQLLGIPLLDHLILGCGGRWTSMRQQTAW